MATGRKKLVITLSSVGIGMIVFLIVVAVIKASIKKRQLKCKAQGGIWDIKTKECIIPIPEPIPEPTPDPTPSPSNDNGVIEWTPFVLANEIYTNIEGYNFNVYPETAEKILALTDAQITRLYKYYNKYKAEDYDSLTKLFHNEWDDWSGKYNMVVDRLEGLQLY